MSVRGGDRTDLESFGVGFGPDEAGVHQSDFGQVLDLFETQGHEFARFESGHHPLIGRVQIALAKLAKLQNDGLGNVGRQIHLRSQTLHARRARIGQNGHAALTTQTKTKRE